MKVLIDFSQIVAAQFLSKYEQEIKKGVFEDDVKSFLKHIIITKLFKLQKDFSCDYNDIILCCDNGSWRYDFFQFYKWKRRQEDNKFTDDLRKFRNELFEELKSFFPFTCIKVSKCEGDDVIACLTMLHQNQDIIICSSDKDFLQLVSSNIKVYDMLSNTVLNEKILDKEIDLKLKIETKEDAKKYLLFHILKGDVADGVPNIKSDNDSFIGTIDNRTGKKKKQVTFGNKEIITKYLNSKDELMLLIEKHKDGWQRNRTLIDLSCIPKNLKEEIEKEFKNQYKKTDLNKEVLMKYFTERKMIGLRTQLEDNLLGSSYRIF